MVRCGKAGLSMVLFGLASYGEVRRAKVGN